MMFERRLLSCAGAVLIVLVSCATGHTSPWPITCQTIFYEDWRSEFFDGYYWTAGGTDGASPRIQEYFGSAAVFLDRPSGLQARVELTLTVDLAGYDNVEIAFDAFARGPRIAPPSEPFSGGCDADGMAVSLDGVTWYPIRDFDDLPHDMAPFVLDLDAAMGYWGLAYTDSIRIRFFVYTGEDWMVKGVVMDNIHITGFPKDIYNFGHAPDPPYPTLLINDGARHKVEGDIRLGATVGTDFDGRFCPSQTPTFRDGVALPAALVAGSGASIEVTVPTACMLDAWFDFDGDGVWSGAGEKVFDSIALSPGTSVLSVNIPADAALSDQGYARFRVSSAGGLSPTGAADDGEVEDYPFTLQCGAPEVEPLPEYSAGDTLTVAWQPLFPGAHYEAQRSLSPDFDIIEATSGWITELSHVFSGLTLNQTHYYRVRAGAAMAGDRTVWRQTRARDFLLGARDQVAICAENGVRLAETAPEREFVVNIDGLDDLRVPFSNGGRMNMFLMTQDVLLTEFAMYLTVPAAGEIAFVVYKGGALLGSPVTRILNVVRQVRPGQGFYGSGDISVALESGVHYYLGVAGPDTYEIHAQSPGMNMD
ncbi:MAG TPA: hypothetical protein ENN29_06820, partial [Candidatus Hydrogenedentes bacterium]|nr:hypothetical protein [Candidatus Hydrogenedentota bacterium]